MVPPILEVTSGFPFLARGNHRPVHNGVRRPLFCCASIVDEANFLYRGSSLSRTWGWESMHASASPRYVLAALLAVALVVIPWSLVGWLIWTLIN